MTNNYYQKHKERIKKGQKDKIFLKKRKQKAKKDLRKIPKFHLRRKIKKLQYHCEHNKNLSEEPK